MFESLIECPEASEEILAKIAGDLIAKYQIKQLNSPHEFVNDVNMALHQMKLYNTTLQQLHTQNSPSHYKLLVNSHQHSFRLIDFLAKIIRKVCSKMNPEGPANHYYKQQSLCDSCNSHIQHKNIKQLQSQILDQRLYQYQQLSSQITEEADDREQDDDRFATAQELLIKKMAKVQKNINERQVNLLRCIDDFQNIRVDLLIGIKKRQFDRDFTTFDLKAYSIELTKHFVANLNRIEEKIGALKRNSNVLQDQGVQVNIQMNEEGPIFCLKPEPLLKSQHSRAEADIRKLNEVRSRLEDNCKRYQVQVKQLNIKIDAIENQNKVLREELTNQKFKTLVKEKTVKIVEKSEERQKKENPQALKRQSMLTMLSNDGVLAGQFANNFIENYILSTGKRDEQVTPLIKATFKRTFDNFFNQRMSLNLSNLERKSLIKHDSLDEQVIDKRRRSKKKSMRFQIETQARQSRFVQKKQVTNNTMAISTQLNYKLVFEKPAFATRSSIQKNASESSYRKSMLFTESSIKRRQNRESKLGSILTQYKENQKSESIFRHQKKHSENFEPQYNDIGIQVPKIQRKMNKSKLNHNRSKFSQEKGNVQEGGIMPSIKIKGLNLVGIDSHVIKQFLFIDDQKSDTPKQANLQAKQKRHKFTFDALTLQTPNRNEKTILNLEQINYLTQFYSLLAKMHIVNAAMYAKLKEWIFSKIDEEKMKGYESKHSLILKKITSQIVFKHRECHRGSNLCPHLIQFLQEVQKCLSPQQGLQQE